MREEHYPSAHNYVAAGGLRQGFWSMGEHSLSRAAARYVAPKMTILVVYLLGAIGTAGVLSEPPLNPDRVPFIILSAVLWPFFAATMALCEALLFLRKGW